MINNRSEDHKDAIKKNLNTRHQEKQKQVEKVKKLWESSLAELEAKYMKLETELAEKNKKYIENKEGQLEGSLVKKRNRR